MTQPMLHSLLSMTQLELDSLSLVSQPWQISQPLTMQLQLDRLLPRAKLQNGLILL